MNTKIIDLHYLYNTLFSWLQSDLEHVSKLIVWTNNKILGFNLKTFHKGCFRIWCQVVSLVVDFYTSNILT